MYEAIVTITLSVLTLLSLAAAVMAAAGLRGRQPQPRLRRAQMSLTGLCIVGSAGLLAFRAIFVTKAWLPLASHLDGLLLIATLFAATVLFVQRAVARGLTVFALPILSVMLAWGICSSAWTYEPFEIASLWQGVHMVSVYVGTLFFCIAAVAGVMYLYSQRRLRGHAELMLRGRLASLETIESLNIRSATIGFALLTLGLITGLIIVTGQSETRLGPHWWVSPKFVLAVVVWLIYAIVMNVRYATAFRGARAAWLSIAGLLVLVAVFSVMHDLPPLATNIVWVGRTLAGVAV